MSTLFSDEIKFLDDEHKMIFYRLLAGALTDVLYANRGIIRAEYVITSCDIRRSMSRNNYEEKVSYEDVFRVIALANRLTHVEHLPSHVMKTVFIKAVGQDWAKGTEVVLNSQDVGIVDYLEEVQSIFEQCTIHNPKYTTPKLIAAINSRELSPNAIARQQSIIDSFCSQQPCYADQAAVSATQSALPMTSTLPEAPEDKHIDGNVSHEENKTMSNGDLIRICKEVACVLLMCAVLPTSVIIVIVLIASIIVGFCRLLGSFVRFIHDYCKTERSLEIVAIFARLITTLALLFFPIAIAAIGFLGFIGFVDCSISIGETLYAFVYAVCNKLTGEGALKKAFASFKQCCSIENIASIFIGLIQGSVGFVSAFCVKCHGACKKGYGATVGEEVCECSPVYRAIENFVNASCVSCIQEEPVVATTPHVSTQQQLVV